MPVQSGGMADNNNKVIYAGNNSAYYPHELVHFYNFQKAGRHPHFWVDEGIATLFGGSTGYELDWHIEKLRIFMKEHPEFTWNQLDELAYDIPNGEFTTDFRYVIGGMMMKLIYEAEGMNGLFDAIQTERNDEAYYELLENKLGVQQSAFVDFVKSQLKKLKPKTIKEMQCLKC